MLTLNNITVIFNESTSLEKKVLSSLSLEVEDGDFICILGSNGAGKSTLFNAITGAFFVDTGRIVLDNEDITFKKEHLQSCCKWWNDRDNGDINSYHISQTKIIENNYDIDFKNPNNIEKSIDYSLKELLEMINENNEQNNQIIKKYKKEVLFNGTATNSIKSS